MSNNETIEELGERFLTELEIKFAIYDKKLNRIIRQLQNEIDNLWAKVEEYEQRIK